MTTSSILATSTNIELAERVAFERSEDVYSRSRKQYNLII